MNAQNSLKVLAVESERQILDGTLRCRTTAGSSPSILRGGSDLVSECHSPDYFESVGDLPPERKSALTLVDKDR